MDEDEFQRLLNMFPVVRSRDYNAEAESSSLSGSPSAKNELKQSQNAQVDGDKKETETQGVDQYWCRTQDFQDAFWGKLRSAVESKVSAAEAERFCDAFRKVYHRLVYEEFSVEAAQSLLNSS